MRNRNRQRQHTAAFITDGLENQGQSALLTVSEKSAP